MTPQESELVDELFNRLVQLETAQRDPEAERLIADGLRRAPHAVYALVQTVLLQDEALKRANARIEELQAQTNAAADHETRNGVAAMVSGWPVATNWLGRNTGEDQEHENNTGWGTFVCCDWDGS